jgi:hypothetical protein
MDRQPSLLDKVVRRGRELGDRLGRTVDRQHVTAGLNTGGDLAGGGAGTAADLDDPEPGPQG